MSEIVKKKSRLHPNNKHQGRYNFDQLIKANKQLEVFVIENKFGVTSIDFFNPEAVKELNKAILFKDYQLEYWDIPAGYLCPPIPGRADYVHHLADLLLTSNFGKLPLGDKITCVDVGTGANLIYPIIGTQEFGWNFIATDIEEKSIESASLIVEKNKRLEGKVQVVLQPSPKDFFYTVIDKSQKFDLTLCNPPFHSSKEDAAKGSQRKIKNLTGKNTKQPVLNFAGQSNELWTDGGELRFITNMMKQSKKFGENCYWFSTLVSKQAHLNQLINTLKSLHVTDFKEIEMGQGNKTSRILAWTFLSKKEQLSWKQQRWQK